MLEKDESIETLRGIAIILLVSAHIIGSESTKGIHVDDDSFLRYFYFILSFVRMPLFTVISGFVYAIRPVEQNKIGKFILGKSRRLLLPLIFVSTLHYITMIIVPGTNKVLNIRDIYRIYFYGFDHFWFLQSVFIVFLFVVLFEILLDLNKFKNWLFFFLISCLVFLFLTKTTTIFSFNRGLYLLPFFILGIGLNRFSDILAKNLVTIVSILIFIIGIILLNMKWFGNINFDTNDKGLVSLVVGITSIITLFYFRKSNSVLAKLGSYSYGIYLFHIFGTAGTRIISMKLLNINNKAALFFLCIIVGLILPIIIENIIMKNRTISFLFLGKRLKPGKA